MLAAPALAANETITAIRPAVIRPAAIRLRDARQPDLVHLATTTPEVTAATAPAPSAENDHRLADDTSAAVMSRSHPIRSGPGQMSAERGWSPSRTPPETDRASR